MNESTLRRIIRESIINEISQQTKAKAIVRTKNDIDRLVRMTSNGERMFTKNGHLTDVENEKTRRRRQLDAFEKGLGKDIGGEVKSGLNGYTVTAPYGHAYSNESGSGVVYGDNNSRKYLDKLSKFKDVTDAMYGYDDELNGTIDRDVDSMKRRQRNVKASREYDDALDAWKKKDIETREAQSKYDRMPFYRKLFKKRPADAPQKPKRPEWIPNEKGEFDGYFQKHNPEDYENDINAALDRKEKYRKAKERYFGK